jgi:hypothetical protein
MRKYSDIDGFYNYTRNSVEEFGSPDKGGNFWKGYQIIRSSTTHTTTQKLKVKWLQN